MSYATLGNSCTPRTVALTSNRKFLLPDANVYNKFYTEMANYPSADSTYTDDNLPFDPLNPERIKFNHQSKETSPMHYHPHPSEENQQEEYTPTSHTQRKNCSSCRTLK